MAYDPITEPQPSDPRKITDTREYLGYLFTCPKCGNRIFTTNQHHGLCCSLCNYSLKKEN